MNSRDNAAHDDLASAADRRLEEHIARTERQIAGLEQMGKFELAQKLRASLAAMLALRRPAK